MSDEAAPRLADALDVEAIRAEFPILSRRIHGRPLVYLDNAATTQKPECVIEAVARFYREKNANIHRGVHTLSQEATEAYEEARGVVARFLNAAEDAEIVFTRGTTESINLVAASLGSTWREGDEVVLTHMEHHSNIVPWQMLRDRRGIRLRVAPITDEGELDLDAFAALLGERTRLVAVVHQSNSLGTLNPIEEIARLAHEAGALVLVDGAQATSHHRVDVRALGADFYATSGHKMFGPTGIGVLYGRRELLEGMEPWQGGGDMILNVTFERTTYNRVPHKFEAGTPHVAGPVGLAEAIRWIERVGIERIEAHEERLLRYADERLAEIDGLRFIGRARRRSAVRSFVLDDVHPHDVGTILDRSGVAVRTGHHCTQPVMERFGVPATVRASFAAYNTTEDVDRLVEALARVREVFR